MISEDVDERDLFMGLRNFRCPFVPIPLGMKDAQGHHVPFNKRAAEAATHYGTAIWGTPPNPAPPPGGRWGTNKILHNQLGMILLYFTIKNFVWAINKLKRNKASGPDDVPIECFKEMEEPQLELILILLNLW